MWRFLTQYRRHFMRFSDQFLDVLKNRKLMILMILLFLVFTFHYSFNVSFRNDHISVIFSLIFVVLCFKKLYFKPSAELVIFCTIAFVLVTLPNYLLDRLGDIPKNFLHTYKTIIRQYFWVIPFMFLPTIYKAANFKVRHFFGAVSILLSFMLFYLLYYGYELDFNRSKFSSYFDPVISYDIGFISLCIILLCYSFYKRGRGGYFYLILSVFTMFMLILHGSRGTWIGIPVVYVVLSLIYIRTETRKTVVLWLLFTTFIVLNLIIPESPMFNRIAQFHNDADMILQQENFKNSSGIRLSLWKHGLELFQQSPLTGVSLYEIQYQNCRLYALGQLPQCFQHLHNIYVHELAAHGLLGLLALVITFFSALFFFFKRCFTSNAEIKNLALTGLMFVLYYMLCGLTEYYLFFVNTTYLFYGVTASIMSFILIREYQLKQYQLQQNQQIVVELNASESR